LLIRCVCGPLVRTACPTFKRVSMRITAGPAPRPIANAVSVANTARKVMKLKIRIGPMCSWRSCASQSSMLVAFLSMLTEQMLHHALHFHETRSLDQRCCFVIEKFIQRIIELFNMVVMRGACAECFACIWRQLTQRQQTIYA